MNTATLTRAIHDNDVEQVKKLIGKEKRLVNANKLHIGRFTPIEECLYSGSHGGEDEDHRGCEVLEVLVNHGGDVKRRNKHPLFHHNFPCFEWVTPVVLAVAQNCSGCLRVLVQHGAELDIGTETTLLILAAQRRAVSCASFLIQQTSRTVINQRDRHGLTALMWAIRSPGEDALFICQKLIQAGADLNFTTADGKTALILAMQQTPGGPTDCARLLIQHSHLGLINHADSRGWTALIWAMTCRATVENSISLYEQLLIAGADVNIACRDGKTALMFAIQKNNFPGAAFLVKQSTPALINHRDVNGMSALMLATRCQGQNAISCCKQLIEAGADLNIASRDGETALILAIQRKAIKCVGDLRQRLYYPALENKKLNHEFIASIRAIIVAADCFKRRNGHGITVLEDAADPGSDDVVPFLLEKGAEVNMVSGEGATPLYHAVICTHVNLVNRLFSDGADTTVSIKHGRLMFIVISNNNAAKLRTLVMHGFPPQDFTLPYFDDFQWPVSPLFAALLTDNPDIARYLIANKFFTRSDTDQNVSRNAKLRQIVQQFNSDRCLQILDFHLRIVQTLSTLCMVTISSVLVQDFREEHGGKGVKEHTQWIFKPTFKERVESLRLPPAFKRVLLHQTPSSRICCEQWKKISLDEENYFPDCKNCDRCAGQVKRFYRR